MRSAALTFCRHPSLAIVGSRNATAQGEHNAESFARALSNAGLSIVSGLAVGIDAAAHRGGLAGTSSTIAVLGTGIDVVYPKRNVELVAAIAERGLLVSEFPLGTAPLAHNFPRRNRLISGWRRAAWWSRRRFASGSLITARTAADQDARYSPSPARSIRRFPRAVTRSSNRVPSSSSRQRTCSLS